ncbi:hypothetical protein EBI_22508 [Enterocytozoon bieneusi H348]|nr:hypothetical protein EBI_22508 [Enterocytozoon bieneusi H348]|eukprot:XP_002651416.1 hypothetical protein EBI_22508 [Enterocytozoon bieneusi H348]
MFTEQILEVVASFVCANGGGFVLLIEGSDTSLVKGNIVDILYRCTYVATRQRPQRRVPVRIFRDTQIL